MEAAKRNLDLTEGVIWKKFLLFLLPIAIGTLFQQFYSTVDAVIVGQFVGADALAAVGGSAAVIGYDSFLMFNVYAQRATRPEDMDQVCNAALHRENMAAFRYVLEQVGAGYAPAVWAAWGTIIEKRPYLRDCVRDMVAIGEAYGAQWLCAGRCSKKGHPHHPLYLRKEEKVRPFAVVPYLDSL